LQSTPLVKTYFAPVNSYLANWDRTEVGRRALVQILALRCWQLEHGGHLPRKLDALVTSGLLAELPSDPYTPRHYFGYVRSSGQALLPLGDMEPLKGDGKNSERTRPAPEGWLLYSVGPDMVDSSAQQGDTVGGLGDIVFPLAESTPGGS
jgi:hypothetical protein